MTRKPYKPQEDRFLKQLSQAERSHQKRIRTLIIKENLLAAA